MNFIQFTVFSVLPFLCFEKHVWPFFRLSWFRLYLIFGTIKKRHAFFYYRRSCCCYFSHISRSLSLFLQRKLLDLSELTIQNERIIRQECYRTFFFSCFILLCKRETFRLIIVIGQMFMYFEYCWCCHRNDCDGFPIQKAYRVWYLLIDILSHKSHFAHWAHTAHCSILSHRSAPEPKSERYILFVGCGRTVMTNFSVLSFCRCRIFKQTFIIFFLSIAKWH